MDQEDQVIDEERELIAIEDYSQRLEALYKEMEHFRRENLLFESYIIRNTKDLGKDEEIEEKKGKKNKKEKAQEKKMLSNEEKYEIANFESEILKKNIDEGRIKSDTILETLRSILEETDMAITEIRKDAFDFQREILIGGENSRTGKIEAERIIKYREEKIRQKDALIEKYKAKKATLETQILKTENQIKKKEEMGDDLKFIDFHQLQIENKVYVKEIDEKNKKLLMLKIATGKIMAKLTNERKMLQKELERKENLENEISDRIKAVAKTKEVIIEFEKEKQREYRKNRKLDLQAQQIKTNNNNDQVPQVMSYAFQKKEEEDLQYDLKNLRRKIEITQLQYKKCLQKMGKSQ